MLLVWLCVQQVKHDDVQVKDGGVKMISEIFLTRLLSTKVSANIALCDRVDSVSSAYIC